MECLIVIDMQNYFDSSHNALLIENIVEKIWQYREANYPILLVQYVDEAGYPLSLYVREIRDAVKGYDKVYYVDKTGDDGGNNVDDFLEDMKLKSVVQRYEVCGVNTDCCVLETLLTLAYRLNNVPIYVALDCCNSTSGQEYAADVLRREVIKNQCSSVKLLLDSFRQIGKIAVSYVA